MATIEERIDGGASAQQAAQHADSSVAEHDVPNVGAVGWAMVADSGEHPDRRIPYKLADARKVTTPEVRRAELLAYTREHASSVFELQARLGHQFNFEALQKILREARDELVLELYQLRPRRREREHDEEQLEIRGTR